MRKSLFFMVSSFLLLLAIGRLGGMAICFADEAKDRSPFTIVLLPDTQKYTIQSAENNPYSIQTQWIKDHAESSNIKFVIHLGDIVESSNCQRSQWQIASDAQAILEQGPNPVPYSVMPGNHDSVGSGSPDYTRDASLFNEYFSPSRFANKAWYGGHQGTTNENNYTFFNAAGMDFMVLSLDMLPTDETLDWANGVIQAHPDHRVIVATHRYLQPDGTRSQDRIYGNVKGNNGTDIFNKLIKGNDRVFMTVSGHLCYEALNIATNDSGGNVYEILSDYQTLPNGGDGWLRTLKFLPEQNKIVVGSYSPVLNKYNYGAGEYAIGYDMGGTGSYMPEPAVLKAYWKLDDGQANLNSTTAGDAIPNGSDGTLLNFATPPSWIEGKVGDALKFDGTNDRVDMGNPDALDITGALSMSFWMCREGDSAGSYGTLLGKNLSGGDSGDSYYVSSVNEGSTIEFALKSSTGSISKLSSAASITNNQWHHISVVFDPGVRMAIYLDGVLDAELFTNVPLTLKSEDTSFALGNLSTGSSTDAYCFNGRLDEVRVYRGVLSVKEIQALAGTLLPGDANADGRVDGSDVTILANHWQTQSDATWAMGDFNNDGRVDGSDVTILAGNWQTGVAMTAATVPEPSLRDLFVTSAIASSVCAYAKFHFTFQ